MLKMCVLFTFSSYGIHISDGRFYTRVNKTGDWFHVVLNFVWPRDGIKIYHGGVEVKRDRSKAAGNFTNGDRRIVIGRRFSGSDERYASVQMDELLFFNEALTKTEITILSKYRSGSNILFYILSPFQNYASIFFKSIFLNEAKIFKVHKNVIWFNINSNSTLLNLALFERQIPMLLNEIYPDDDLNSCKYLFC